MYAWLWTERSRRHRLASNQYLFCIRRVDRTLRCSRNTIGAYASALDQLVRAHPADEALRDQTLWLTADSSD